MQEHVVHNTNVNEHPGGPHVVPADASATQAAGGHPFPGTEPIENPDGGQEAAPRKPSWAERRAAKRAATAGTESTSHLPSWLSWDLRAKLAVVLSFVILLTVLIWNRPGLKKKDAKPTGTPIAQISNAPPKEPKPQQDKPDAPKDEESPAPDPNAPAKPTPASEPAAKPATEPAVAPESPPALPNDDRNDSQKNKQQASPLGSDNEAPPILPRGNNSPPAASPSNDSPPDLPAAKPTPDDKKEKAAPPPIEEAPPLPATTKSTAPPKDTTDSPPNVDTPPKLSDAPSTPVPVETPPVVTNAPTPVAASEQPKVEPKPVESPAASMPQLAPTPPAGEAPKDPVTTSPTLSPSAGGGYSIPSAGLIRASSPSGSKTPPGSNATVLATAPATARSVPVATGETRPSDSTDGTVHIVRRGENFWTISRYHYSSGRFYMALWYANRDLAKTPEDLYVGTPIRIPAVEELNPSYIEAPKTARSGGRPSADASSTDTARDSKTRRASGQRESTLTTLPQPAESEEMKLIPKTSKLRTVRANDGPKYRTYVVRGKHETLRSIAARELGDPDLEEDLYRVNRDEFDEDSTKLRVGMTLKIPDDSRSK